MNNVLLSADGPLRVYSVPDEVAADLRGWADRFREWMLHAPEAACYRRAFPSGAIGLCFNEEDFIAYLNNVIFPDQPSVLTESFDADDSSCLPEPFCSYPQYNF